MTIRIEDRAKRQLKKLPRHVQQKMYKQLELLIENPKHPSLGIKKMVNSSYFEGRIDYHYRFAFLWENDEIAIVAVGTHDTGLGKK